MKAKAGMVFRSATREMLMPAVITYTTPRAMPIKHSVTMKWERFSFVTIRPMTRPHAAAPTRPMRMASSGGTPRVMALAENAMDMHITAPMDRSRPPEIITTIMPMVRMPMLSR